MTVVNLFNIVECLCPAAYVDDVMRLELQHVNPRDIPEIQATYTALKQDVQDILGCGSVTYQSIMHINQGELEAFGEFADRFYKKHCEYYESVENACSIESDAVLNLVLTNLNSAMIAKHETTLPTISTWSDLGK